MKQAEHCGFSYAVLGLENDVLLGVPGVVAARPFDAVALVEATVEPDRGVECCLLMDEEVGELGLERVRGVFVGEVPAELLARLAERVGYAIDQLANAAFTLVLVAVDAGLAEVLGHRNVGRELTPALGDLSPLELEHHRAVRIGNLAVAKDVFGVFERVRAGLRQLAVHR